MTAEVEAHETSTHMVKAAPSEVGGGTEMVLRVRVSCFKKCNLRAYRVRIVDAEGAALKEIELTESDGASSDTDQFVVKAPVEPGEFTWTATFPAQEKQGVLHEQSSARFSFTVKPHATSMAVWDVPSPIAIGGKFKIKVGVKCSAECNLTDKEIAVYGPKGKKVATGRLGEVPWPGTGALYWGEVQLEAPAEEGRHRWRVKFPKPDLELPHEDSSHHFAFTTARPPQHTVTVEVSAQGTSEPIGGAHVVLRPRAGYPYRGLTDEGGAARVAVPKGKYTLFASKGSEYARFQTTVEVGGDVTVRAELTPEYHPYG